MRSSASESRKLLPFVPDVPYHIQLVFVVTFSYIWYTSLFSDEYDAVPNSQEEEHAINVSFEVPDERVAESQLVESHHLHLALHVQF